MLLYRVDVSEKLLRQIDNLTVQEIVNLVLRREIEKVWMENRAKEKDLWQRFISDRRIIEDLKNNKPIKTEKNKHFIKVIDGDAILTHQIFKN